MNQILDTIHRDHRNYSILLSMLNTDIDNLQKGERADFIKLYDIMNYMTNYPDVKHHPTEEIIFDLLETKDPAVKEGVVQLTQEHRQLADTGLRLLEKLHTVISGGIVSKESITQAAKDYHELLRNHLNFEEGKLLPVVKEAFSEEDWEQVATKLSQDKDPLFGDAIEEQFTNLFQRISSYKNSNVRH